jgi:hypothetical protein
MKIAHLMTLESSNNLPLIAFRYPFDAPERISRSLLRIICQPLKLLPHLLFLVLLIHPDIFSLIAL